MYEDEGKVESGLGREEEGDSADTGTGGNSCMEIRINNTAGGHPASPQDMQQEKVGEEIEEIEVSVIPKGEGKTLSRMEPRECSEMIERASGEKPEFRTRTIFQRRSFYKLISCALFGVVILSAVVGYYFHSRQGVAYYIEKLGSTDAAVRSHARDSLSKLGPVAVQSLERLVKEGGEREAVAAVDTLALIEGSESDRLLYELAAHENPEIRKRALAALGGRITPKSFSMVKEQVNSEDYSTRLCAIESLERFDPQETVPILLALLGDSDWRIRNKAGKVLCVITGKNFGVPLSSHSETINELIRRKWTEWWENNKATFKRPVPAGSEK